MPLIPMVFEYDGDTYREKTIAYPALIRRDLAGAIQTLQDVTNATGSAQAGTSALMHAYADYILINEAAKGREQLTTTYVPDLKYWLDQNGVQQAIVPAPHFNAID